MIRTINSNTYKILIVIDLRVNEASTGEVGVCLWIPMYG